MELNIRGEKIVVTKAIKDYVMEKLSKLDKYFDSERDFKINVLIKVKNEEQRIEVTMPMVKFQIRAEETHNDLYAAIDLVADKLERQIRKNKTKLNNKYKNIVKMDINTDFEVSDDALETKVVKRKNITTKPMDEEEAILQMELINHDFFVFKNIEEECVSVIYKRKDGDFGIINVK